MAWWIPMAISAASSLMQAGQASAQNKSQLGWNRYNAQMRFKTDMTNIAASHIISGINASAVAAAGAIQATAIEQTAKFNANMIRQTADYNDSLLEEELSLMWDSINLDLQLLDNQRAVERGELRANQAASGVIMDQDSAQDVVVDQKTQEALDAFIIRHGGDIQAAKINNARAQGQWQADAQIVKTIWEGQMGAWAARASAGAQAGAIRASGNIAAAADTISAGYKLKAGMAGSDLGYNQNQTQISNSLMNGIFSAAAQGASNYYRQKPAGGTGSSLLSS